MIVADASAIIDLLLLTPGCERISARFAQPEETVHAPAVLDLEVAQVLRRRHLGGDLSHLRANEAWFDFRSLVIERHFHQRLLGRIWELRHNLTAYDAAYLALAEMLNAPLLTRDGGLARIARRTAAVELI